MKDFFWYFLSKVVLKFFFSLQINGKENYLKLKDKPLIIASNHFSYLDGVLLLLIDRWKFYFLVDKTMANKTPVLAATITIPFWKFINRPVVLILPSGKIVIGLFFFKK